MFSANSLSVAAESRSSGLLSLFRNPRCLRRHGSGVLLNINGPRFPVRPYAHCPSGLTTTVQPAKRRRPRLRHRQVVTASSPSRRSRRRDRSSAVQLDPNSALALIAFCVQPGSKLSAARWQHDAVDDVNDTIRRRNFAPPRDDFLLGGKPAYMSEA
jgi:hypothetical protein